ncbi:MAG: hydroxymethylbilane synthase [Ferruginibacter sp.]|nr:hydroxymethylbilane synthase [Ferruginibacter sp.]
MGKLMRIGTRESQLAVWQATLVQQLLAKNNYSSELVFIKSEGDMDLQTPLYQMGVKGIFTKSLDIALLANKIDIAVHSMKDVPTQLAKGIIQSAVLERASHKDILVYKGDQDFVNAQLAIINNDAPITGSSFTLHPSPFTIATSSIRRKAQWLNRYPGHAVENLRGNVNTRLRKVQEQNWNGAIFAAAGLERIQMRPENAVDLDWMLPAPAQGAIMVVCRDDDRFSLDACQYFNHTETAICTRIERDFLSSLLGGCSTPISALAQVKGAQLLFKGNILSVDGKDKVEIEKTIDLDESLHLGNTAATEILNKGGNIIADAIRNAK